MSSGKKILLVIGIIILGFFVFSGVSYFAMSDEEKARWERAQEAELLKEKQLERQRIEIEKEETAKVVESARFGEWIPVDTSKLNDQKYHDRIDSQIESYFLNYKGNDNVGFTIQEVLLMGLRTNCGLDTTLENVEVYTNFLDLDDTVADNKLTFTLNTSSEKLCADGMWWFAVDPKSGEVFAWEDSAEENILSRVN